MFAAIKVHNFEAQILLFLLRRRLLLSKDEKKIHGADKGELNC